MCTLVRCAAKVRAKKLQKAVSRIMRVSGVWAFFLKEGRLKVPYTGAAQVCTPSMQPSEAYIKEGRGSGSDLATHKHNALTVLAATPAGNAFLTSGRHALLQADSLHSAALSARYPKEHRADNAAKAAFGVSPTPDPDMRAEGAQPRGNEWRKVKGCCVSVGSSQLLVARAFMH